MTNIFDYYDFTGGNEKIFQVEAPKIKFGVGAMHEVGEDAKNMGMRRVAVITDPRVAQSEPMGKLLASLKKWQVTPVVYSATRVEPTDGSFADATAFAVDAGVDGFISLGGGSVIDTCKAANLYATYPADLLTYVNAPIGAAQPVPGKLKPHISCPTTFGTASDCTGISIFDFVEMHAKTGIVSSAIRPELSVCDPENLYSMPPLVTAANGFDVFSHACESYTARPFTSRNPPDSSAKRPLSQGANPYSDFSCLNAIKIVGDHLVRTVNDSDYKEGFHHLMFAGLLAGIGFGNAGCHLPHGMSYAVSGLVKEYRAAGWPSDIALVPHGISVIVNSPAVFAKTGPYFPERHKTVAAFMGADVTDINPREAGTVLRNRLIELMQATNIPNGLSGVGYTADDLDNLVEAAFPQKRVIDNAPIAVSKNDLRELFRDALSYW